MFYHEVNGERVQDQAIHIHYDAKEAFRQRCAIAIIANIAVCEHYSINAADLVRMSETAELYANALTARFFPDDQN